MKSISSLNQAGYLLGIVMFMLGIGIKSNAQINNESLPFLGAQVFIEPGQTEQEIDEWFQLLEENNFTYCRIRMFESYMNMPDGTWDYSLFDYAFKAADKHHIKVFATLFPYTEKVDIGGFKFPRNGEHLESIVVYIDHLVNHFKKFKSLNGWVLINEPGSGAAPENEFARQKYEEWLLTNPVEDFTGKGFPILIDQQKNKFLKNYNTWYLNWLATEIRKHDTQSHLHVNSHGIFNISDEYNFPEWRKFLNSLGGSAHPSWHFGYFDRSQYALAMSANSEIIRSGSGELPWLMTEIQGGNNLYSSYAPFCPTAEEITQWLWIVYASEAKGAIFWSLNPRSSGMEAGEWALLTLQDQPSDRILAAKEVAETLNENKQLFQNAKEFDSGINILYIHESMWAEKAMAMASSPDYEGRNVGAVMKSSLAYFEAISEMGINCNFKEFNEFDFNLNNYTGQTIILANQIAIPSKYSSLLEHFVLNGGKLIVEGLTAFFDENLLNTMKTGSPFETLLGGKLSEYKLVENLFELQFGELLLPAHLWRGSILTQTSTAISNHKNEVVASRNKFGDGEVLWIPSLLGLGGRITKDYTALNKWLKQELDFSNCPLYFSETMPGVLMKTMASGDHYVSILINKSDKTVNVPLIVRNMKLKPYVLFPNKENKNIAVSDLIEIQQEETIVIEWH